MENANTASSQGAPQLSEEAVGAMLLSLKSHKGGVHQQHGTKHKICNHEGCTNKAQKGGSCALGMGEDPYAVTKVAPTSSRTEESASDMGHGSTTVQS